MPIVQCEWSKPPRVTPTSASNLIYTTPMVADLDLDKEPGEL